MKEIGRVSVERMKPEKYQALLVRVLASLRNSPELLAKMREMPRWEKYFTEKGDGKNRDMEELGHAINTFQVVKELSSLDGVRDGDLARVKIAAIIHDLGELGKGDVSYADKTNQDVEDEKGYFRENITQLFSDLSQSDLDYLLQIYFDITQANKAKDNKESVFFNIVERLGYLKTALEEYERKPKDVDWARLCGNVLHHQGKHLLNYVKTFPVAVNYLKNYAEKIREMVVGLKGYPEVGDDDIQIWQEILEKVNETV